MNREIKEALVHTAVFAALGPPGGAVVVLAFVIFVGGNPGSLADVAAGFPFIFLALVGGYIFGTVPAALIGLASFLLRPISHLGAWVAANMLMGLLITGVSYMVVSKEGWAFLDLAPEAAMFGAVGAIAALLPSLMLGKRWAEFHARRRA